MAADVCRVLGFNVDKRGAEPYLCALGAGEKMTAKRRDTPDLFRGMANQVQQIAFISESGLCKLVMRSDKPEAKDFQNWVTRVVVPAIRKDGGYIQGEEKVLTGEMSEDELMARAFVAATDTQDLGSVPSVAPLHTFFGRVLGSSVVRL